MKTKDYVLCGLFAAIISISSIFTIPLPFTPIPITLQVMAVLTCGSVLGAKKGSISVIVYILLGAMGLPVFSGMKSGFGILFGATGGFILGFIPSCYFTGWCVEKIVNFNDSTTNRYIKLASIMILGLLIIYLFGTVQFMFVANLTFGESLMSTVIPFVAFDLLKITLGVIVANFIQRHAYSFNIG